MTDDRKEPGTRPDREEIAPASPPLHPGRPEGHGPADLPPQEDYDEAQRAEILEAEGRGPSNGTMQTDIPPDIEGGLTDEDEIEDEEDELDIVEDTDAPFIDKEEDWTIEEEEDRGPEE